jgi:hypothetical protein
MAKHDELIIEPTDDGRRKIEKPHAERASAIGLPEMGLRPSI